MDLGELRSTEKSMTQDMFNILVDHRDGDHEDDPQYDCPICREEVERWRDSELERINTKFEAVVVQDQQEVVYEDKVYCVECGNLITRDSISYGEWRHVYPGHGATPFCKEPRPQ